MSDGSINPQALGMRHGDLPKIQGFLNDAKPKFNKESAHLEAQIQSLLSSGFKGEGANALQRLQQAWTEKHNMIVNTINQFEQALGATNKWNLDTDSTAGTNFSSRMSALD